MKKMTAKYNGKCTACFIKINAGSTIYWSKQLGAQHEECYGHPAVAAQKADAAALIAEQQEMFKKEQAKLPQEGGAFKPLFDLFTKTNGKLKRPKLTFRGVIEGGGDIRISKASDHSANPGSLYVAEPGGFGNRYYGKITPTGVFVRGRDCAEPHEQFIQELGKDPLGTAVKHGHKGGHCCFCGLELTSENDSVKLGYGPQCAANWHLPWGKKAADAMVSQKQGDKAWISTTAV